MPSNPKNLRRILILGGTTEARELAGQLGVRAGLSVVLSLAGRTKQPAAQPVPVRVGGFGGADGLAHYLAREEIDLLIDATHPFAARITANAQAAARAAGASLLVLRRPGWQPEAGDRWHWAGSVAEALAAIGPTPRRVFAALGRQELAPLEAAPQHFYLVRSVDPVQPPLRLPDMRTILDRGPFAEESETALLCAHRIDAILCKNSGGAASFAKLLAARALGLPVFLVRRPAGEGDAGSVAEVLEKIDHVLASMKRGE